MKKVVIEFGSYYSRVGFTGQDSPENVYQTTTSDKKKQYIDAFSQILKINPSELKVVVLKDTGTNQNTIIEEASLLFNEFKVNSCYFKNAQTAILLSWGHGLDGLIIDIGYEKTICVPIIRGNPVAELCKYFDIAGKTIEQSSNKEGVIQSLINSITESTISIVATLGAKNLMRIIICGGGSKIDDIDERLITQLKKSTDIKAAINRYQLGIRNTRLDKDSTSSWRGGSIFSCMVYSDEFFTTREDFMKNPSINLIDKDFEIALKEGKY